MPDDEEARAAPTRSRIAHRTARLSPWSGLLHRIDHVASLPGVAIAATTVLLVLVVSGFVLGFPAKLVAGFEVCVAALTLVMVFAIQHTQAREQAATQRKLDELIRALPGASAKLMMLEEASKRELREVEETQRDARSDLVERPGEP